MRNLNPKILYWIFLAVVMIGVINTFWFNVFFNPLLAVLFFVALNFSFPQTLFFAIFYGFFLDTTSSVAFGQHILSFIVICVTIFIFRKFFALKNNVAIFLVCLSVSLLFYISSIYIWGVLFGLSSGVSWSSLSDIVQENTINLIANFILVVPVYLIYFLKKGDLN
jgi:hypothetical protein